MARSGVADAHAFALDGSKYENERIQSGRSGQGTAWGSVIVDGSSFAVQCPTSREALHLVFSDVVELTAQFLARAHAYAPGRLSQLAAKRLGIAESSRGGWHVSELSTLPHMGTAVGYHVAMSGGYPGSAVAAASLAGTGAQSRSPDYFPARAPSEALLSEPLGLVRRLTGERARAAKTMLASYGGRVLRSGTPIGWAGASQGVPVRVFWRHPSVREQLAIEKRILVAYGGGYGSESEDSLGAANLVNLGLASSVQGTLWGQ